MAVPTDYTHLKSSTNSCAPRTRRQSQLEITDLENSGYCHYKVCAKKYGNKTGETRNPDVIYNIYCEETTDCTQVYLRVEVTYTKGSQIKNDNIMVPTGCLYSRTNLKNSTTVEPTTPKRVS
jgi:hypothetical protein